MEINERRVQQQIRNFERALNDYTYTEPLARYLTRFFKENKQMGSSDRRMTSRLCYNYFRLGNSLKNYSLIDRLAFAEYLCESESALVQLVKPELSSSIKDDLSFKILFLEQHYGLVLHDIFPFYDHISPEVNVVDFIKSHFIQPDLFIRIKKDKASFVKQVFEKSNITFTLLSDTTFVLPNGTNLQQVSKIEGAYEVQDLSSQKTIDFIQALPKQNWWDACAASGGKALMFLDHFPKTNLLVSDIRMSTLRNLDERFERAGISRTYRKKILDLSQPVDHIMAGEEFDGIIVDVPCSGSGTWGRTPEMIQQFSLEKLKSFSALQKSIVSNVVPYLKKGGVLTYITCSVYNNENEGVVDYLIRQYGLQLVKKGIIKGYGNKSDSMFAAQLVKI